jgi:multidrug efflux pump subunit AcrA (membrane-fusion protein)
MSNSASSLPKSIQRPLWIAGSAVLVFIVFLVAWACLAQISTTIRVNGSFQSALPEHNLQHRFGGTLAEVNISVQSRVNKDDVLLKFDVQSQTKMLLNLQKQIQDLEEENWAIGHLLVGRMSPILESETDSAIVLQHIEEAQKLKSDINSQQARFKNAASKLIVLINELQVIKAQKAIILKHEDGRKALVKKGIVAQIAQDNLTTQQLRISETLLRREQEKLSVESDSEQAQLAIQNLEQGYRLRLIARQAQVQQRLPSLKSETIRLTQEIQNAAVRSPISGIITDLSFDTANMVVSPGQTIVTIAEPLDEPTIDVRIPVDYIDQVYVDMEGKLTINSLSQRDVPQISITLTAISPVAIKSAEDLPIYYLASAKINERDLKNAKRALGNRFRLATDMPISAALNGQTITLFTFLFKPISGLFESAFEDT